MSLENTHKKNEHYFLSVLVPLKKPFHALNSSNFASYLYIYIYKFLKNFTLKKNHI